MSILQYAFPYRELNTLPPEELKVSKEDNDITGLFAFIVCSPIISDWDTSNIASMKLLFYKGHMSQDLSSWDISSLVDNDSIYGMFYGTNVTMKDLKNWGWLDQRPDLNWKLAFTNTPVELPDNPMFFTEICIFQPYTLWSNFTNN